MPTKLPFSPEQVKESGANKDPRRLKPHLSLTDPALIAELILIFPPSTEKRVCFFLRTVAGVFY